MKTTLIAIGNSRGIRIPKPLIEHCGLVNEVELEVRDREIVVRVPKKTREDWEKRFAEKSSSHDHVDEDWNKIPTQFEEEDWEWK